MIPKHRKNGNCEKCGDPIPKGLTKKFIATKIVCSRCWEKNKQRKKEKLGGRLGWLRKI